MLRVAPELRSSPFLKALQSSLVRGATAPKAPFTPLMDAAHELGDAEAANRILDLNRRADKLFADDVDFSEHLPEAPHPVDMKTASSFLSGDDLKAANCVGEFFKTQDAAFSAHMKARWGDYVTLEQGDFETKEISRLDASRASLRTGLAALKSAGLGTEDINVLSDLYANRLEQMEQELETDTVPGSDVVPFMVEQGVKMHDTLAAEAARAEERIAELNNQKKAYELERDNLDLATVRSEVEAHPEWYWEAEDDIVNHRWDPDGDFDGEDPHTWKANWEHVEFPFGIGPTINIPGIDAVKKAMNRS